VVEDDEGRSQRRLVLVLSNQTVTIESPCFDASLVHSLKRVAATTDAIALILATTTWAKNEPTHIFEYIFQKLCPNLKIFGTHKQQFMINSLI